MQINISNLAQGIHTYSLEAGPEELHFEQNFTAPVKTDVTVDKSTRQILLDAKITGSDGHFVCDRCLEEFAQDIHCGFKKVYYTRDMDTTGLNGDEIEVLSPDTNIIDISDDVRDALLLAIPLKLLCREDCAGLCSRCGKNLNAGPCGCAPSPPDARWEALARLRDH